MNIKLMVVILVMASMAVGQQKISLKDIQHERNDRLRAMRVCNHLYGKAAQNKTVYVWNAATRQHDTWSCRAVNYVTGVSNE